MCLAVTRVTLGCRAYFSVVYQCVLSPPPPHTIQKCQHMYVVCCLCLSTITVCLLDDNIVLRYCYCLSISVFVHLTHSNIIQVGNHGNRSVQCCKLGECICSSLFNTLQYLDINTVVNITEDLVVLDNVTQMGTGNLSNVTIVGNHVTACLL